MADWGFVAVMLFGGVIMAVGFWAGYRSGHSDGRVDAMLDRPLHGKRREGDS